MDTNKVLSALSYFSILFAGIIFPLVVYFVSEDSKVKSHAKKALFSHLIPLIPIPVVGLIFIIGILSDGGQGIYSVFLFLGVGLSILLSVAVLIWNIIKGVKVLQNE
jgi:uncharacterized Tic20 family protein